MNEEKIVLLQRLIREEDINSTKLSVDIPKFSDGTIHQIKIEFARDQMGTLVRISGYKSRANLIDIKVKKTDNDLLEEIHQKVSEIHDHLTTLEQDRLRKTLQ